jgi:hypothetical protein
MTVLDIIKSSLRLLGVLAINEEASAEDAQDAFNVLNWMLGEWSNERLAIFRTLNEVFPITANVGTYTIGAAQTFNTTHPIKITSAFVRDSSVDYQVEIIPNDKWQAITQKSLTSTYPQYLNYNAAYPAGTISLWPIPSKSGLYLGLSQYAQLTAFTSITQSIQLPLGYEQALRYNLAVELSPEYGIDPKQVVVSQAIKSKAALKRVNIEEVLMSTDSALASNGCYNIYTDI